MANKKLRDLLDEEAAAAEEARGQDQDAPLPPHVKVTRGNPRSRVLQVRLKNSRRSSGSPLSAGCLRRRWRVSGCCR